MKKSIKIVEKTIEQKIDDKEKQLAKWENKLEDAEIQIKYEKDDLLKLYQELYKIHLDQIKEYSNS